jgi:hypothetical protein
VSPDNDCSDWIISDDSTASSKGPLAYCSLQQLRNESNSVMPPSGPTGNAHFVAYQLGRTGYILNPDVKAEL